VGRVLALVVVDTCCVVLLAVLVVGLLRSHADILRALHSLGAGVGDPLGEGAAPTTGMPAPVTMGPSLPRQRSAGDVHDVAGVTPTGDAVAVSVAGAGSTLLAFVSSGCATCATVWSQLSEPTAHGLPADTRVVVVTKGPELEIPAEVASVAPADVLVVMSSVAWSDYEVPGSPFFVLVDGEGTRRAGEGLANDLAQVADLVRRARADDRPPIEPLERLDGRGREARNDRLLAAAGVLPGDPSLYPKRLDEVAASGPTRRD
jgi:hypothetical protein